MAPVMRTSSGGYIELHLFSSTEAPRKCNRPNENGILSEKFSCTQTHHQMLFLGGGGVCGGGVGAELSDGSCVRSSVFLKKKNKTLHVCSPTGSVAKRCSRTNRKSGSNRGGGAVAGRRRGGWGVYSTS